MSHPMEDSSAARDEMSKLPLEPDARWPAVFADANLPSAVVELDAMRHNRQQVIDQLGDGTTTIRVATRGIRSTSLLRHLLIDPELVRSGTSSKMQGLACDTALEACSLLELGFDDVLIHTPVCTMGMPCASQMPCLKGAMSSPP